MKSPSEQIFLGETPLLRNNAFFAKHKEIAFFLFMLILPTFFKSCGLEGGGRYEVGVLNDIGIYVCLALSLNIILGNCGLFNMGHAAFFAIGAYTTAILNTQYGVPVLYSMPLAGILAGLFAFVTALPVIHLRGDYLLLVTIGIVEIVRIALVNDVGGLTGGSSGAFGIDRPEIFGFRLSTPEALYYLIWSFTALSVLVFSLLNNSRFGRALNYIKSDDLAAAGNGINITRYKIAAFTIGGFWAGMVGTLFAAKMRTIGPEAFTFSESVLLFAIVILGGAGSIPGVILGSFLLIGLPELFRELASARLLFFGIAMCAMMIFRPAGLLPVKKIRYAAAQYVGKFPSILGNAETSLHSAQTEKANGGKGARSSGGEP